MRNQAMARKLKAGEAIDVEKISMLFSAEDKADPQVAGTWRIESAKFVDDSDYFVGSSEEWIWSIGRHKRNGSLYAALDTRFYQNPDFECVWLR